MKVKLYNLNNFKPIVATIVEVDNIQQALAKAKSVEPYLYLKEELAEKFNIIMEDIDNEADTGYYHYLGM